MAVAVKKLIVLLMVFSWTAGFSQTLSFKFGTPFKRADLDIQWNIPTNAIPKDVFVYRLSSNRFSPRTISYLMTLGPFTDKDRKWNRADGMRFTTPTNNLSITYSIGAVGFQSLASFGPTNLARHVPSMSELPALTTNFLGQLGIDIADVAKQPNGKPDFHFSEPFTEYAVGDKLFTNIAFRAVGFRRAVDGAQWVGANTGGDCRVEFGEFGKPSTIWLSWRKLERYKKCPAMTPRTIIESIRGGRAVQNMISMDADSIDWSTVKGIIVTRAEICYYAGGPFAPSDWLIPFVALWTTVDRGHGNIDVEIDCPIIDAGKPSATTKEP